jgi:diguanylate cyclase (GGDEF)-like protein/PAS domain S-box-containing protein
MKLDLTQVARWLSDGEDFLAQGDYARAIEAFGQALDLAQRSADPQAELVALQRQGQAHLGQGQPSLSVALTAQAIAIALDEHNLHALCECHRQMAQAHKQTGSYRLALQHLEAAENLRDRLGLGDRTPDPGPCEPGAASPEPSAHPGQDSVLLLFRAIVEQANAGIAVFQDSRLVYSNPCLLRWTDYSGEEISSLNLDTLLRLPGGETPTHLGTAARAAAGQLIGRQGQIVEVEIYTTPISYGDRPALVTFLRDVTTARRVADQLKTSEERYRSLIHHVPMGLCRFSLTGQPLDANPALIGMFGHSTLDDFLQASPIRPDSPVASQSGPRAWGDYLRQPEPLKDCELQLTQANGHELWVRIVARAIADSSGTIQHYEAAVEDITAIKIAQAALEELAMRDSLTQVYNRRHFMDLASREIARSARFHRPVTLLMLDIDHFKTINDTHGHLVGDAVLRDIALRLTANLRQSDLLARYGGEEFILLMPETDQAQAWIGAERLRRVIAATPFNTGQGTLSVTASIGLSCWSASTTPPLPQINDLIDKADQALYRAKHLGRNQTQAETWLSTIGSQLA